jgi:hypothetical protein
MSAILQEAGGMNNARAVYEPLHSSKCGAAARCDERTGSTGIPGSRPHHRHDLTVSTCRTFSLDGRDPLSLERARAPPHEEATETMRVLGFQVFQPIHRRETLHFLAVNCSACEALIP